MSKQLPRLDVSAKPSKTGLPQSSTAAPRRRLQPDERRSELLDAAIRVLRERGPEACRVEDITTEARTAKGNFYRYFPTWDDLLLAVRDHLLDGYADSLRQRLTARTVTDWWETLEMEVACFIDFHLGLGPLHDAAFHGPASRERPIDQERTASGLTATFLTGGIADGAFDVVDVNPTAVLLFYMLHGAADEIAAGADRGETQRAVLSVITKALAPCEPASRNVLSKRGDGRS